jgi:eukaryotic-like serine/threonine-protein kinase
MGSAEITLPTRRAAAPRESWPRGHAIGRYLLLDRLGEGGVGEVFAAYDPHLDRRVALKLLRRDDEPTSGTAASDQDWRALLREAQALARLSDPHVVAVHDVGVFEGRTFIAMELVEGVDLATWLARERGRQPWQTALALLREAGAGLAAAHAAGVIHRDFKPANVLIRDDAEGRRGRQVKVGDFGLARRHGDDARASTITMAREPGDSSGATGPGAIPPGTPYYMAPELFEGGPASVRSDVYAFGVTMYEALVGERPHRGTTLTALVAEKHEPMPPIPASVGLPRWLIAVIERALAIDPAARWPDMTTLLAALDRQRSQRTRGLLWLAAGGTAVGLAWAFAGGTPSCTGAARHLAGTWDDARSDEIVAGVRASALPYAGVTADDIRTTLDDWSARWIVTHEQVCERSLRGEQSSAALDARMACLDDARMRLGAVLTGIHTGEDAALERASAAVHALDAPEGCAELAAASLPPGDPRLRERIAVARAALELGDVAGAEREAIAVAADGELAGDRAIELEAGFVRGLAELGGSRHVDAEHTLTTTIYAAQTLGAPELQVRIAVSLASLLANHTARFDEAARWLDYADAELARADTPQRERGRVLATRAGLDIHRGATAEAIAGFEVALAWQTEHDDDALRMAITVGYYGVALRNAGRFAEAVAQHQRALALRESVLGPDHPLVALSLNHLGRSLSDAGKPQEAAPLLTRALAIRERVWGPEHLELAETLIDIASNDNLSGDFDGAAHRAERALTLLERSYPGDHIEKVIALNELGRAQESLGDIDAAAASFERGLAIAERLGERPDDLAVFQLNLGVLRMQQDRVPEADVLTSAALAAFEREPEVNGFEIGSAAAGLGEIRSREDRWAEAEQLYERALAAFERILPPDHAELSRPLLGLGICLNHAGRFDDAAAVLDRALGLVDGGGGEPAQRVIVRMHLADALAGRGAVAAARERVEQARALAVEQGPTSADLVMRADQWSPPR